MFRSLYAAVLGGMISAASSVSTSHAADSQWVLLTEAADFTYYVNSNNITDLPHRNIKFHTLIDLMTPDLVEGALSYSATSEWQMDCNAGTIRLIGVMNYSDHCAAGPLRNIDPLAPSEFLPVTPGSAFAVALKALCLPAAAEDIEVATLDRDIWFASRPSGACTQ